MRKWWDFARKHIPMLNAVHFAIAIGLAIASPGAVRYGWIFASVWIVSATASRVMCGLFEHECDEWRQLASKRHEEWKALALEQHQEMMDVLRIVIREGAVTPEQIARIRAVLKVEKVTAKA